jgi:hypothetical protein
MNPVRILPILAAFALVGCAGSSEVLFVTNTTLGINADSKLPSLSIGYDRAEGYVAPAYENGALPPVMARLLSNASLTDPSIGQIYATGDAAVKLASPAESDATPPKLLRNINRTAFFITESALGAKVTFASSLPDSVHIGYKRKEFSLIPVGTSSTADCHDDQPRTGTASAPPAVDCYGSVLASIQYNTKLSGLADSGMMIDQFFATGAAAEILAAKDSPLRRTFRNQIAPQPMIVAFKCDDACARLQTFLDNGGKPEQDSVAQCAKSSGAPNFAVFQHGDDFADKRKACVAAVKA